MPGNFPVPFEKRFCQRCQVRDGRTFCRSLLVKLALGSKAELCSALIQYITGWWFGTFFIFPYIGNNHPNWLIFFRGVQTTNQIQVSVPSYFVSACCQWRLWTWNTSLEHPVADHQSASSFTNFYLSPMYHPLLTHTHNVYIYIYTNHTSM